MGEVHRAARYDQPLHRDYLNHSVLVPAPDQPPAQVEMFVYLSDVTEDLGPPAYLPRSATPDLASLPNWYPSTAGDYHDPSHPQWVSPHGHPALYADEVRAPGPAGTVVAYRIETFHRGTELRTPRGARYTIHTNFRKADASWISRRAWTDQANTNEWLAFVTHASARQLELFGFPPPGHSYWTATTLHDLERRYPGLDTSMWAERRS